MEPAGLRISVYLKTDTLQTDTRRPADGLLGFALLNPTYVSTHKAPTRVQHAPEPARRALIDGLRFTSRTRSDPTYVAISFLRSRIDTIGGLRSHRLGQA